MIRSVPQSPAADSAAGTAQRDQVYVASWCCSVGMTWTVELRPVDSAGLAGPVAEWICSGEPTDQPAPLDRTADMLGEWGLLLFPAMPQPAAPGGAAPRVRSRSPIGHVTRSPEVMRLALDLSGLVDEELAHPLVLAAQWIAADYSSDAAAAWVTSGVVWPGVAQTLTSVELRPTAPPARRPAS